MKKLEGINILNDGNPIELGTITNGFLFTVSPSTAKKNRGYYTDQKVNLTDYELKMPGVVVCQNRGMLFSGSHPVAGGYNIPELKDINLIVVDEKSRILKPQDDNENKIAWEGNGEHAIKDVCADGQGQHWFEKNGKLAKELWLKIAKFGYGTKGMLMPGLESDIGVKVIDHWGVERTITLGNTIVVNSSLIKGLGAYASLEEFVAHSEEWGLTVLQKQWQSGDHKPEERRIMGTQPNATNLELTEEEIRDLIKSEALAIWAMKFPEIAWMKSANVRTSRGRAIAARPSLIQKDIVMNMIDSKAGNMFLRLAQGKFMAEGQYLKMYQDELALSYVYVHGMDMNEAAKKAAEVGVHGEIRVNPAFAGRYYEDGVVHFKKETHLDKKGRYIEVALVRYPHGAPSETIIVKAYLDNLIPKDVIMFPLTVAEDDGTVPVRQLYAFRLQGADFDGDAVTAYTEKVWLEAQKRNTGKSYMVIPVNTEGTEKDTTLVTDETFEEFCVQKVGGLSNRVGLIATSLKYFMSQDADILRNGNEATADARFIAKHACAMGDDIDEFKHGKAKNTLVPFVVDRYDGEEILRSPYFNRYAMKYRSEEDFNKAVYNKDGSEKKPGTGTLDMYSVATEHLMAKAGLPIVKEVMKASDGKDRWYFTVHPVQWKDCDVDLHIASGESKLSAALPAQLEEIFGLEHGVELSSKDLFLMLYHDNITMLSNLQIAADQDQCIKNLRKIDERFALAKLAVIAWTKAMKAKKGETINAEEALKVFTTLMVQHTKNGRSFIENMTRYGTFLRPDGSTYERTLFTAQRCFNYFLDICGDGLLLIGTEEPKFSHVSDSIKEAAKATTPDLEEAKRLARKELELIDKLTGVSNNVESVAEEIESIHDIEMDIDDDFLRELQDESFYVGYEDMM